MCKNDTSLQARIVRNVLLKWLSAGHCKEIPFRCSESPLLLNTWCKTDLCLSLWIEQTYCFFTLSYYVCPSIRLAVWVTFFGICSISLEKPWGFLNSFNCTLILRQFSRHMFHTGQFKFKTGFDNTQVRQSETINFPGEPVVFKASRPAGQIEFDSSLLMTPCCSHIISSVSILPINLYNLQQFDI